MRLAGSLCSLIALSLLTGCAGSFDPNPTPFPVQSSLTGITGLVHGGSQPIAGAHIFVFAAGTSGYAGSGLAASTANASTSLLFAGPGTAQDNVAANPTYGDYYVTTDTNGNFVLTGDYTCTAGTQVYLYALGGQPTPGVANAASGLLAILGQCPSSGTMASVTPYVLMNEVSTIAAAFAFAGFATDPTHVGTSGSTLAQTGIANAFATSANLYDISGAHGSIALATTPAGNGTVPQSTIDSLADSVATCVDSSGPTSSQCTTLLSDARIDGTATGTKPTDTAAAAINIAHYPGTNVSAIFNLTSSNGSPFVPVLSSAPKDFTLGVVFSNLPNNSIGTLAVDSQSNIFFTSPSGTGVAKYSNLGAVISAGYTGGGINHTNYVAIDPSDNVWVTSSSTVAEFTNSGTAISGSSGYTVTGTTNNFDPGQIAIDGLGNAWVSSNAPLDGFSLRVFQISPSGSFSSQTGYTVPNATANSSSTHGLAIDTSNNVWISDSSTSYIDVLNSSGSAITTGYTGGGIDLPDGIAFDSSGNAWTPGYNPNDASGLLSELSSSGTPISNSTGYLLGQMGRGVCIAADGAGNLWMGTQYSGGSNNAIAEVSNTGTLLSPANGSYPPGWASSTVLTGATSIAVDGSGNVWAVSATGSGVAQLVEVVGIAVPVVTPISLGVKNKTLGTRP